MFKKVSLIIFLSILLAAFLVGRHFWLKNTDETNLMDRLPIGDFLIKANVLNLAKETSGMFHYNKVNFRDFVSQEFLLGQAKSYGIDLQRPVYAFANENGSWGALLHVSDSSEVGAGFLRLKNTFPLKDTMIQKQKVVLFPKEELYITNGKNWLFVYKGPAFENTLNKIVKAKAGDVSPVWNRFLKEKHFSGKSLVIYSNSHTIKKYGIETAMFTHTLDSTSATLLSYVKTSKPFNFKPKADGLSLQQSDAANKFINLHLNAKRMASHPEDPLYRLVERLSKKVSFPLQAFLKSWEGDFSYCEGGTQIVKEKFIESVMDDNFEVTEVESIKETKVKGFSVAFSLNKYGPSFIQLLLKKGILRKEENTYRFLISPPLQFKKQQNYYLFYSGMAAPALIKDNSNVGKLSLKNTIFNFHLDSITKNEAFGEIQFPVSRLLRRNIFF